MMFVTSAAEGFGARRFGALRRWWEASRAAGMHPVIQRRHWAIWLLVASFAVAQTPFYFLTGFSLAVDEILKIGLFIALFFCVSTLALIKYRAPAVGLALAGYVQMNLMGLIGLGYSYFAAALAMPLQDGFLMAVDRAMGLDWMAMMQWITADRWRTQIASWAYVSLVPQGLLAVPLLVLFHRFHTVQILTVGSFIGIVVTVAIFALLPAVSVFEHLGIVEQMKAALPVSGGYSHLPDFLAAREGRPMVLYHQPQGMVPFPSFHACSSVMLVWAFWTVPLLRWPVFALNLLMMLATPVIGSHYFIDVFAGCAVAVGAIALAKRLLPEPGQA
jgi:hypothetical protein